MKFQLLIICLFTVYFQPIYSIPPNIQDSNNIDFNSITASNDLKELLRYPFQPGSNQLKVIFDFWSVSIAPISDFSSLLLFPDSLRKQIHTITHISSNILAYSQIYTNSDTDVAISYLQKCIDEGSYYFQLYLMLYKSPKHPLLTHLLQEFPPFSYDFVKMSKTSFIPLNNRVREINNLWNILSSKFNLLTLDSYLSVFITSDSNTPRIKTFFNIMLWIRAFKVESFPTLSNEAAIQLVQDSILKGTLLLELYRLKKTHSNPLSIPFYPQIISKVSSALEGFNVWEKMFRHYDSEWILKHYQNNTQNKDNLYYIYNIHTQVVELMKQGVSQFRSIEYVQLNYMLNHQQIDIPPHSNLLFPENLYQFVNPSIKDVYYYWIQKLSKYDQDVLLKKYRYKSYGLLINYFHYGNLITQFIEKTKEHLNQQSNQQSNHNSNDQSTLQFNSNSDHQEIALFRLQSALDRGYFHELLYQTVHSDLLIHNPQTIDSLILKLPCFKFNQKQFIKNSVQEIINLWDGFLCKIDKKIVDYLFMNYYLFKNRFSFIKEIVYWVKREMGNGKLSIDEAIKKVQSLVLKGMIPEFILQMN